MKIIQIRNAEKFVDSLKTSSNQSRKIVESILLEVKRKGDAAVKKYEKKFTGANISSLRVSKTEIKNAYSKVSKNELDAIISSKNLLTKTEKAIKNSLKNLVIKNNGTTITKTFHPIESVGCYIPGGLARYPSTVIMSTIPAKIAGVKRIVLVSPPNRKGEIDAITLVAADICGVNEIYKTGGAQAIAALGYGTKTIRQVDKIVGPGGFFVTTAKSLISDTISIDMLAGPTELGIIADDSTDPKLVAVDLISQAEHSKDTTCFVITTSSSLAKKIIISVDQLLKTAKRSEISKPSLEKNGFVAVCKSKTELIRLANLLAPEHLEVMTKDAQKLSNKITTAGLVLVGKDSPSSASDYLFGSNHILPTNRFGRTRGSLSVLDFLKLGTKVQSSKKTLKKLSKQLQALTNAEDLPNHYEAVRFRLK
jgi:histidinol dehydrogenase